MYRARKPFDHQYIRKDVAAESEVKSLDARHVCDKLEQPSRQKIDVAKQAIIERIECQSDIDC